MTTQEFQKKIKRVLITEQEIQDKIQKVGAQISRERGLRAFPYQRRLYQTYAPRPRGDGVGLYPFGTASPRWNTKFVILIVNYQLSIVFKLWQEE